MPIRLAYGLSQTLSIFLYAFFITLTACHKYPKPHNAWGKFLVYIGSWLTTRTVPFAIGTSVSIKTLDMDYSYYLGPNYKSNQCTKPSIVVSNHVSWLDPYMVSRIIDVGYLAKKSCETTPLMGPIGKSLNSLFISRGASEVERKQ